MVVIDKTLYTRDKSLQDIWKVKVNENRNIPNAKAVIGVDELGNYNNSNNPSYSGGLYGVPNTFNKKMTTNVSCNIIPGQLNKFSLKASIVNEHVESSRQIQSTVTSTNIVCQHFKASKDNISSLAFTAESAASFNIDDFESYTNSTDLRLQWVAQGVSALPLLETNVVNTGSKSLALPGDVKNDSWLKTIASSNFLNYTFNLNAYFTKKYSKFKVSFFIKDNIGNSKSTQLIFTNPLIWNDYFIDETTMVENILNTLPTDMTKIVGIGFNIDDKDALEFAYIDNITASPLPGKLGIKLWNMGTTEPVSGTTKISDGIQYSKLSGNLSNITVDLSGGKRIYHLSSLFNAGIFKNNPSNELLIINNYYLIEFYYIDTNVSLYGPDTSFNKNYYLNGFASNAISENSVLNKIGTNSDLMFIIQSMQDIYVTCTNWEFLLPPINNSDIFIYAEDIDMKITDVISDHEEIPLQIKVLDTSERAIFLKDGGKIEFYYNSDLQTNRVLLSITYLYEEPIING